MEEEKQEEEEDIYQSTKFWDDLLPFYPSTISTIFTDYLDNS